MKMNKEINKQLLKYFLFFIAGGMIAITAIVASGMNQKEIVIAQNEPPPLPVEEDKTPHRYKIFTPFIPDTLDFAGEIVPLNYLDVRERMEREFIAHTYWHSYTLFALKRANRWFPIIEPILKKNGIPDDFKFVALIESGLMNVTSPAGAVGYWQFMPAAANEFGLEVNDEVDERRHVVKSTEAACAYLKKSYSYFKNWTLAAASYNMGVGGVQNNTSKQKTKNYYNLFLNEETSRYIGRIISMKEIYKNPKTYGFVLNDDDLYKPFDTYTIKVDTAITDLVEFAFNNNVNYLTLRYFNPWLRGYELKNKNKKEYEITFPKKGTFKVVPE